MKLGQALIDRANLQKDLDQTSARALASIMVQEGDTPPFDPEVLLKEYESGAADLAELVLRINRTNSVTRLATGYTITEAIAHRDRLKMVMGAYTRALAGAMTDADSYRYSRTEIKQVAVVSPVKLRKSVDSLAQEYRALDAAIQAANWEAELI